MPHIPLEAKLTRLVHRRSLPICDMLLRVCKMRIIHEFRKNNDILSAAREAGELLDRWRAVRRTARPSTSSYPNQLSVIIPI